MKREDFKIEIGENDWVVEEEVVEAEEDEWEGQVLQGQEGLVVVQNVEPRFRIK